MHEASIVEAAIRQTLQEIKNAGIRKAIHIYLRIGDMHHLRPKAMTELFDWMKAEWPPLRKTTLHIESVPVRIRCNSCGKNNRIRELFFTCPRCGSSDITLISGNELILFRIEGVLLNKLTKNVK